MNKNKIDFKKTIDKKFTKMDEVEGISVSFLFVRNVNTRLQIKIEKLKDDTCLAS